MKGRIWSDRKSFRSSQMTVSWLGTYWNRRFTIFAEMAISRGCHEKVQKKCGLCTFGGLPEKVKLTKNKMLALLGSHQSSWLLWSSHAACWGEGAYCLSYSPTPCHQSVVRAGATWQLISGKGRAPGVPRPIRGMGVGPVALCLRKWLPAPWFACEIGWQPSQVW